MKDKGLTIKQMCVSCGGSGRVKRYIPSKTEIEKRVKRIINGMEKKGGDK